jgi:hypothetical protein
VTSIDEHFLGIKDIPHEQDWVCTSQDNGCFGLIFSFPSRWWWRWSERFRASVSTSIPRYGFRLLGLFAAVLRQFSRSCLGSMHFHQTYLIDPLDNMSDEERAALWEALERLQEGIAKLERGEEESRRWIKKYLECHGEHEKRFKRIMDHGSNCSTCARYITYL